MSKDTVKFYFKTDASAVPIEEIAAQLVAIFERSGDSVSELTFKKKRNDGYVSFWAPQSAHDEALGDGLRLLVRSSGDRAPYAEVEMDQTNDTFFYALAGDHTVSLESRQEVIEHYAAVGQESVEQALVQEASEGSTVLLVRVKFDKKRPQNELLKLARSFVALRSDETYQAFKQAIDAASPEDVDFPFTRLWRDDFAKENMDPEAQAEYFELMKSMRDDESEDDFYDRIAPRVAWLKKQRHETEPLAKSTLGNLELGRALRDCAGDKKYLFFLFVHETAFGIEPCKEDAVTWQARNNILNGEGLQVLELLECLQVYEGVDSLAAKLYSPLEGASAHVSSGADSVECMPRFDNAALPPAVWP